MYYIKFSEGGRFTNPEWEKKAITCVMKIHKTKIIVINKNTNNTNIISINN